MPDEPTYPKAAAVGAEAKPPSGKAGAPGVTESGPDSRRKTYVKAGVAFGIGSAAIVAALLYANRGKRNDKGNG